MVDVQRLQLLTKLVILQNRSKMYPKNLFGFKEISILLVTRTVSLTTRVSKLCLLSFKQVQKWHYQISNIDFWHFGSKWFKTEQWLWLGTVHVWRYILVCGEIKRAGLQWDSHGIKIQLFNFIFDLTTRKWFNNSISRWLKSEQWNRDSKRPG